MKKSKRKQQNFYSWVIIALVVTTLIVVAVLLLFPGQPIADQVGCLPDPRFNFGSLLMHVQNRTSFTLIAEGDKSYSPEKDVFVRNYKIPETESFKEVKFRFPKGLGTNVVCGVLSNRAGKWLFTPLAMVSHMDGDRYFIATILLTGAIPFENKPEFIPIKEVE